MKAGMVLKGLIFDLDGTLADTLPLCYAAYIDVFSRFVGRVLTPAEVHAMFGPSEEGIIRRVVPRNCGKCPEAYLAFYQGQHDRYARKFAEVIHLLGSMRNDGLRVGVVTGKGERSTRSTIEWAEIGPYIDTLRWGTPSGGIKAAGIRQVLEEWGCSAAEVAYVGDAAEDMGAAREAGVLALGAAWVPGSVVDALRAAGAVEVFESAAALRSWISDLNAGTR